MYFIINILIHMQERGNLNDVHSYHDRKSPELEYNFFHTTKVTVANKLKLI
jgi:hypothetical protein